MTIHEYHSHNLCVSNVHIQQSDDCFLDHKCRKTFFILRGHMMITSVWWFYVAE